MLIKCNKKEKIVQKVKKMQSKKHFEIQLFDRYNIPIYILYR